MMTRLTGFRCALGLRIGIDWPRLMLGWLLLLLVLLLMLLCCCGCVDASRAITSVSVGDVYSDADGDVDAGAGAWNNSCSAMGVIRAALSAASNDLNSAVMACGDADVAVAAVVGLDVRLRVLCGGMGSLTSLVFCPHVSVKRSVCNTP